MLIRVQVRTIGWQVEQFDFTVLFLNPFLHKNTMMNFQIIQNEKHFSLGILD